MFSSRPAQACPITPPPEASAVQRPPPPSGNRASLPAAGTFCGVRKCIEPWPNLRAAGRRCEYRPRREKLNRGDGSPRLSRASAAAEMPAATGPFGILHPAEGRIILRVRHPPAMPKRQICQALAVAAFSMEAICPAGSCGRRRRDDSCCLPTVRRRGERRQIQQPKVAPGQIVQRQRDVEQRPSDGGDPPLVANFAKLFETQFGNQESVEAVWPSVPGLLIEPPRTPLLSVR